MYPLSLLPRSPPRWMSPPSITAAHPDRLATLLAVLPARLPRHLGQHPHLAGGTACSAPRHLSGPHRLVALSIRSVTLLTGPPHSPRRHDPQPSPPRGEVSVWMLPLPLSPISLRPPLQGCNCCLPKLSQPAALRLAVFHSGHHEERGNSQVILT